MTKANVAALLTELQSLKERQEAGDPPELLHRIADHRLLTYIDNEKVKDAFLALKRGYRRVEE